MTGRVLATVRPGPALHLWQDGREVARVPRRCFAKQGRRWDAMGGP
jgi:hypothetical protein